MLFLLNVFLRVTVEGNEEKLQTKMSTTRNRWLGRRPVETLKGLRGCKIKHEDREKPIIIDSFSISLTL